MYLTQHTDYGLRVLVYTAINDDTLVNISTIAETYNISKSHLMKVVTSLVKGGFLVSVRGKGGGLRLADVPEKINIGAVVRHLEPMQVVECMGDNNECLITPSCRLTGIITGAIKAFFKWVSASISTSSKAVETGDETNSLSELPPPPAEVNIVV